jgi:alkylation response protein AidB-like acyl-CoA dehydrogenase
LITRTDPALPKHKGLTMFLVPLNSEGIEIQALYTIGDERTNIVYYGDVRVPDRYRIGEVNNGWSVLHGPLDAEHYIGDTASKLDDLSPAGHLAQHLEQSVEAAVRWAKTAPDRGGPVIEDKVFLAGIGRMLVELEAGTCTPGAMGRVKGSDVARLGCEELIDLVGPAATLPYGAEGAIGDGVIEYAHREAQHTATPGGTVEVFRTIIAQHDLGLPRPDYPGRKVFLQQGRPATAAA